MSGHRVRSRTIGTLRGTLTGLALAALVGSSAAVCAEGVSSPQRASSPPVAPSWRSIQFQGVSLAVPRAWPIYDLSRAPRCAREDVQAVYVGHGGTAGCPARLVGRSEAVHVEPLDPTVAAESSFATRAAIVNNQRVRLDPAADVTHRIVVAIDQDQVLATISFRGDHPLATRVLNSLTVSAIGNRSPASSRPPSPRRTPAPSARATPSAPAPVPSSGLLPGRSLPAGRVLVSTGGAYRFTMQGDGNLVLYDAGLALWSSGTEGNPGAVAIMQGDGNLVVYGGAPSRALWSSGTQGHPGSRLIVQGDGNVVIYGPAGALWATATSSHFTGLGFDTCGAPDAPAMGAWLASPFRAVGIYLGGANRACPDGNLSASWVTQVTAQGWSLLPLYVGLQAPCNSAFATIDTGSATGQGSQAADDAFARARALGIPVGAPIFFDMEGYSPTGGPCTAAVTGFLSAWARELRAHGARAGVYSSLGSGIADLIGTTIAQPDQIWFATWDGNATTSDPAIPDSLWPSGHRIKQYLGGQTESYGGVALNIDRNYVDALVR